MNRSQDSLPLSFCLAACFAFSCAPVHPVSGMGDDDVPGSPTPDGDADADPDTDCERRPDGEPCTNAREPFGGTHCEQGLCVLGQCGDGFLDDDEQCDEGERNSDLLPDACREDCRPPWCGDGVIDSGEACDDGLANSDSVAGACRRTCVRDDPCEDVACSGLGNCIVVQGTAECDCDPGYHPEGTDCVCDTTRFYLDVDGDGFGDSDEFIDACEPEGRYRVTAAGDCCDIDADAFPGQALYFGRVTLCDSYDFDCDGMETRRWSDCGQTSCPVSAWWDSCPAPTCWDEGEHLFSTRDCDGNVPGSSSYRVQMCH